MDTALGSAYKNLCITVLYLVPSSRVRGSLPAPLKVAEVVPGFTVGGIYAAKYGRPGYMCVSEFGIMKAYASYGDKRGFLVEDLMSDKGSSHDGCRGGDFSWEITPAAFALDVSSEGRPVISLRLRPIVRDIPLSTNFPFICMKGGNVVSLQNHFVRRVGVSTSRVSVPEGSFLKGYLFGMKLITTFWDASNIVVKEPELVPKRAMKPADNVLGTPIGKSLRR